MRAIDLENRYSAHNYEPLPVVLARGKGAHLWDTSGRRYVDMMSAYSAASHGHAHPRILEALAAQAGRLAGPDQPAHHARVGQQGGVPLGEVQASSEHPLCRGRHRGCFT